MSDFDPKKIATFIKGYYQILGVNSIGGGEQKKSALFERQLKLPFFFDAIKQIIIDNVLIRHPCFVGHILKIIYNLVVKANRYLLFKFVGVRILYAARKVVVVTHNYIIIMRLGSCQGNCENTIKARTLYKQYRLIISFLSLPNAT